MTSSSDNGKPKEQDGISAAECVLVTGFPAFTARRFAQHLLECDGNARVFLLARDKFRRDAAAFIASLPPGCSDRIETIIGDVCHMDLGLSGDEYRRLTDELTTIHHLAGIYHLGVDRATARRVNVDGTRGVLDLARGVKNLRRLCHWSTASVAGKRSGVVLEEELDEGQSFHNFYEETKFEGEMLASKAQRELPITIFRPSIIVGDSRTGEIDKFDGPYYLMVLIATNHSHFRVPLPGRGTAPLHLVPINFVTQAAYALSIDESAAGRTFHLTDSNPFPARRVYEMVAEIAEVRLARGFLPASLAKTVLKTPGLERIARAPLAFIDSLNQQVFYNNRNACMHLRTEGVHCPSFDTYVEPVVRHVRKVHDARQREVEDHVFDPFD